MSSPTDNPINANPNGALQQGTGEPGFERTAPLITPDELVEDYLFGIPLVSALTGEQMTEESIKRAISKAVGDAETSVRIPIQPVRTVDQFDYERADDSMGFGTKRLTRFPLLQVEALQACFPGRNPSDPNSYVNYPTQWVVPSGEHGLIRIVPVSGIPTGAPGDVNLLPVIGYQGVLASNMKSWPNMWKITYTAGFNYDAIPIIVNDLIGTCAALRILSRLGPVVFPANAVAVGFDGMTQSTSTMGPQFLSQRMQELELERQRLTEAISNHYGSTFHMSVW